jgi:hypothetical protein
MKTIIANPKTQRGARNINGNTVLLENEILTPTARASGEEIVIRPATPKELQAAERFVSEDLTFSIQPGIKSILVGNFALKRNPNETLIQVDFENEEHAEAYADFLEHMITDEV